MAADGRHTFLRFAIGIAVFAFAVAAGLEIYFLLYKPMTGQVSGEVSPPEAVPVKTIRGTTPEVRQDFVSLGIETNYTGYFDERDKCRKTYDEMFGSTTGASGDNSACHLTLKFTRAGRAEKSVAVRRFDPESGGWKSVETRRWSAKIPVVDFDLLSEAVAANEAFRSWPEGGLVTSRNATVTATYADGRTRSPMSNVDGSTTVFLALIEAFQGLDKKTVWVESK